jgi:peptidoglycan/LPS O-acetylase OafA/YrhL
MKTRVEPLMRQQRQGATVSSANLPTGILKTLAIAPKNERNIGDRTSPTLLQNTGGYYRPELDALRFGAFLCVFLTHGFPRPSSFHLEPSATRWLLALKHAGDYGVSLFFILSSYLIMELLRRELRQTSTIHLLSFYMRRLLRIWPLYFTIITLYCVAGIFRQPFRMEHGRTIANLLLIGNWYIFLHPSIATPLRHLWSISVEEQFYVLWPSFFKVAKIKGIAILSIFLILLSICTIASLTAHGGDVAVKAWLNSFVEFQFFAIGCLISILLRRNVPNIRRGYRIVLVTAGATMWLLSSYVFHIEQSNIPHSIQSMITGYEVAALGSTLIFVGVLGINSEHIHSPLRYLGKISYGLYVFHETGLLIGANMLKIAEKLQIVPPSLWRGYGFLFTRVSALCVTTLLAALSYRFLETPFLGLKKKFTIIRSREV